MCEDHRKEESFVGCEGMQRLTRRQSMRLVGAGLGTGMLTMLAEQLAVADDKARGRSRPKSLLVLWLQGGPSQLETFDPHSGTDIGGEVKSIATTIPNISIADTMPRTAEQLHLATLVRTVISKEGDHERATYNVKNGWRPDPTLVHPSIGAVLCHQQPSNLEIPRHISIQPSQWPARGGYFGPEFDAFQVNDPAQPIPNLTARVDKDRMDTRLNQLLGSLESEFRRGRLADMDRVRTQHQTATTRAVAMMSSEQLDAFDLKKESKGTTESFGDHAFGRGCLAAIRLIERGVRCVEVELNGWDSHINNHELQSGQAAKLDTALSAILKELERRELLNDTIVLCGGEFGRTPSINPAGGRDHWPHGFSILLAGGAFRRGHVHGNTAAKLVDTKKEELALDAPVTIADLHATVLKALDVDYSLELITPVGRPLKLSDGNAVDSLLNVG
ncbi:MAG: DUF1501 domain-containing protein [Pirellulales bacterium]